MEPCGRPRSTNNQNISIRFFQALTGLLCFSPIAATATTLDVTVDTSHYAGTAGYLAFDLLDGDWTVSNRTTVSQFSSDGTLGAAVTAGSVSGSLAPPGSVTLTDENLALGISELMQSIRFGRELSFVLELSEQAPAPSGFGPDSFAFFILDHAGDPLFETNDWSGADALFAFGIDGSPAGALTTFAPTSLTLTATWTVTPTAVPLPATAVLFGSALLGGLAAGRRGRSRPGHGQPSSG